MTFFFRFARMVLKGLVERPLFRPTTSFKEAVTGHGVQAHIGIRSNR